MRFQLSTALAIVASVIFASAITALSTAGDDIELAKFKITTKHEADRAVVTTNADQTVISITSPSGIGQATIERSAVKWPANVLLRLRLNGLEGFRISNGKTTLHVAVSSSAGPHRIRVWKDGHEDLSLDPKDPLWTNVLLLDANGKPTEVIPLTRGNFEMKLPSALFDGDPKSITLDWIDFYR